MAEPKISMREDEMNKVHQEQTRLPVIEADFLFVSLVQLPTIVPALRQAFPRMGEEEILSKLSRAMVKSHLAGKTAAKYAYIPRTDNLDFREYVTQLEEWTRTEFKEPDANRESLFAQTDRTQLVAIIRQVIPAMTPNPSASVISAACLRSPMRDLNLSLRRICSYFRWCGCP